MKMSNKKFVVKCVIFIKKKHKSTKLLNDRNAKKPSTLTVTQSFCDTDTVCALQSVQQNQVYCHIKDDVTSDFTGQTKLSAASGFHS